MLGACLVIPQEYAVLSCRLLDLDRRAFQPPFVNVWGERLVTEAGRLPRRSLWWRTGDSIGGCEPSSRCVSMRRVETGCRFVRVVSA
jgi:hypothetical protein